MVLKRSGKDSSTDQHLEESLNCNSGFPGKMLYYIILYYSILYYSILYYIILYYIILYYIICDYIHLHWYMPSDLIGVPFSMPT